VTAIAVALLSQHPVFLTRPVALPTWQDALHGWQHNTK